MLVKDLVNPKKWFSFIRGVLLKKFVGVAYCEQVIYRITMPECSECVKAGKCQRACECMMPAKAMDPKARCEGNWSAMLNDKNWETFKKIYNIKISVE